MYTQRADCLAHMRCLLVQHNASFILERWPMHSKQDVARMAEEAMEAAAAAGAGKGAGKKRKAAGGKAKAVQL